MLLLVLKLALVRITSPRVPDLDLNMDPLCSLTHTGTCVQGPSVSGRSNMVKCRLMIFFFFLAEAGVNDKPHI